MALKPTKVQVRLQAGTDRTLYATWFWNKAKTEKYDVYWDYYTEGKSIWFDGNHGTSDNRQSTYSAPSNAVKVRFKVRAVAKKGAKWKCSWSTAVVYQLAAENLTDPGAPSVTVQSNKLTGSINDYTAIGAKAIKFEVVKNNTTSVYTTTVNLQRTYAGFSWDGVEPGCKYKVRARGVNGKNEGPWSAYSENISSGYGPVDEITSIETYSIYGENGGVRISWTDAEGFDSDVDSPDNYEVEYTDDIEKFDSGETQTSDNHKLTHAEITGLTVGRTYYFRVRANDGGSVHGRWSPIASSGVGVKPDPPTTWSYTDLVTFGEDIILNWTHSSEDGSKQSAATITFKINETTYVHSIDGDISTLRIQTDSEDHWKEVFGNNIPFPETDAKIFWKVSTKGVAAEYSESSAERSISLLEPVTVNAQLYSSSDWLWDPFTFATDTIFTAQGIYSDPITTVTAFPVKIGIDVTPTTQTAISYAVSITADSGYWTEDKTGEMIWVSAGDEIYSGYFTPDPYLPNYLAVRLFPSDIDLENNTDYTVRVTVAMDSGLTGECTTSFDVGFEDEEYELDADISSLENYAVAIRPICRDEFGNEVDGVYLSVYRREYDGKFTPISEMLDGAERLTVTDPHPALDYARYRVVATSKKTGAITYEDIPGYEMGVDAIVIQWGDVWRAFDVDPDEAPEDTFIEGNIVVLPYNIDISVSHAPDVSLVNYIGNESPTSYYGTQRGESGSWNCEIPKSDKDTLFLIRKLAKYMGDVYVREPSGIGYWANVVVSYSEQNSKTTIPVSFNITRVEGGV